MSPHPLDFDWRFDTRTIHLLTEFVGTRKVLALGVPSLARSIEASGGDVLLIDRQPGQAVRNLIVSDVRSLELKNVDAELAIADPPWYPQDLIDWAAAGARSIGPDGVVLISVWPPETRPSANVDLAQALEEISQWAKISDLGFNLYYETPRFEEIAMESSSSKILSTSPKHGRLIQIKAHSEPPQAIHTIYTPAWQRFCVDGYQLAIRLAPRSTLSSGIARHPNAIGWLWPFVSARAPGREQIGIWSSEGEVGLVAEPYSLISILKAAFATASSSAFESSLTAVPELLSWKIPRPPYREVLEWQHM